MDATAIWTLLKDPARVFNRLQRELMRVPPLRQLDEAAWRRARAEHAAGLPAPRPGDAPVLSALEEVGVAVTSLEELGLPGVDRLLESIGAVERTLNHRARRGGSFTRYPLEPVLYRTPLLVSAALDEHLLDLAHRHIGLPPRACSPELREDHADGVPEGIRQWHVDPEDRRMLKVIVYLVDVGLERGPFEFIPADASARACASLGYVSGFVDDATLARHAERAAWRPCPGPAGTAIVADTCRVLHRARPARGGSRRSLTLSFVSCRPRKQYDSERPVNLPALLARLTPRQRKALPVSWIAR